MDYRDLAIDRIHYLVERSAELYRLKMDDDAELLMEQAMHIADDLRRNSQPVSA
jgi:hypothetical protein